MRVFLALCLAALASALFVSVVAADTSISPATGVRAQPVESVHEPPVDAPVIDPFRPPAGPYAPGNRGLEYDTVPGQTVRASAGGVVSFAGQVGGHLFVTIEHDATLWTTVGFVDEILVNTGDRVEQGDPVAIAGHTMHFTARRNGRYIDPETLFVRYRVVVRLVE